MTCLAAYTPAGVNAYPPYVNISDSPQGVHFTVRGTVTKLACGTYVCGETSQITIPHEEARALLKEALEKLS